MNRPAVYASPLRLTGQIRRSYEFLRGPFVNGPYKIVINRYRNTALYLPFAFSFAPMGSVTVT